MKKHYEDFLGKRFESGEKNLVFFADPGSPIPGAAPDETPEAAPEATPTAPEPVPAEAERAKFKTSVDLDELSKDIDPKKAMNEFSNEFNNRVYDLLVTVNDRGEKYNFDKWVGNTAWGNNPKTNEICSEIQTVCGDFQEKNGMIALTNGLKANDPHAISTLKRCVDNLHKKQKELDKDTGKIEDAHDIPVANFISECTENMASFYNQQDGAGKIAVIGSLFFVLKVMTDKELMEQESPFGMSWKQVRNFALAGLGANILVSGMRDDHEAPISFGLDRELKDVPADARAIFEAAGIKEPARLSALGTLATFDQSQMDEWFNCYLEAGDSGYINPEQLPFGFNQLTPKASEQRGKDLFAVMKVMVKESVHPNGNEKPFTGEEAFRKRYLENPKKAHNFMSIAADLGSFGNLEAAMDPEKMSNERKIIMDQLFPVLEDKELHGDFEPELGSDPTDIYLKSVHARIIRDPDSKKFTIKFSNEKAVEIDLDASKPAIKTKLELIDSYVEKDVERRISTHPELAGKDVYWDSQKVWAINDVTIAGTHYNKVFIRPHRSDLNKFILTMGDASVECGTQSLEVAARQSVYAHAVSRYPGGAFEGLPVFISSSDKSGDKVKLEGDIAGAEFTAEYDETTKSVKMETCNYSDDKFTNEKRRHASKVFFRKETFQKLGNLADIAPEKSWINDSIDEGYWKGLVEFKHYEALNLYADFISKAQNPDDVAKADRRLKNSLREVEKLYETIESQISEVDAKISEADFEEWIQSLDNLNFWYTNPDNSYQKFMLDVRKDLQDENFEGFGEDEYEVFMLVYREVSDATSGIAATGRNATSNEKSYLDYVKGRVRAFVTKSKHEKEDFKLSLSGIKNLSDYVKESVKSSDVRSFLEIDSYETWAHRNNLPSNLDTSPSPDPSAPEMIDGRYTERGAFLKLQADYNFVKKALKKVSKSEAKDLGALNAGLKGWLDKKYDYSSEVAGESTIGAQKTKLKSRIRELIDVCEKNLTAAGFKKFKDNLPSGLEY
jgi:hypothetical protein